MDGRLWTWVLGAGLLACAALPAAGDAQAAGVLAVVLGALVAAAVGIRRWSERPSPWWLVLAGAVLQLVAVVVHAVAAAVSGVDDPYPSVADPIFLLSYGALIAGAFRFIRFRTTRAERDHLLDALIVAVGATVVAWVVLLSPYVRDGSVPIAERVLGVGYSTVLLVLLAAITRVAVGPGARNPSYYLLAGSAALVFLNDALATVRTTSEGISDLTVLLAPVAFVLFAAAANHPSMARITDPPADVETPLTWRRQLLLGGALLVPSLAIVWNKARDMPIDVPVLLVGSVALAGLVVTRLGALVRSRELRADHETVLRRASAALVTATNQHDILDGALVASRSLTEAVGAGRASVLLGDGDSLVVAASLGVDGDQARGTVVDDLGSTAVGTDLRALRTAVRVGDHPVDLPAETSPGAIVHSTVIPLVSQNALRGALVVSTGTALPRATREDLERLAGQVALALESAALTEQVHRRRSEQRFRALVESSSDLVTVIDGDRTVTFASPAVEHLLGYAEHTLLAEGVDVLLHDDDRHAFWERIGASTDLADATAPVEIRMRHAEGTHRWFEVVARDRRDDPDIEGFVVTAREVSDRKRAEARLARSEARFRSLVQHSSDIVAVIDDSAFFSYVSPSIGAMLGFRPDELVGTSVLSLLPADEVTRVRDLLGRLADERFEQVSLEVRIRSRTGAWHTLDVTVTDLRREAAVEGIVLNARDVTDRKRLEDDLRRQALSDALTGLGNRTMFLDHVDRSLDRNRQATDESVGVLFIDLDDFKTVNDSLGHAAGDELLVLVAERLTERLRTGDVAARLGGDEFAVLLDRVTTSRQALDIANRILGALDAPFSVRGREIAVTSSIGIALATDAPADGDEAVSAETLLRNADMALYTAKERGKHRAVVFEETMHAHVFERLELKTDLAQGIDRDELVLHYQPIVSLSTGRVEEVEALVRWQHPTRGMLSPDMFIPLAEETGLVNALGRWVLGEACRQLRAWQEVVPAARLPRVGVNVSVVQLRDGTIVDDVHAALRRNGLDASQLVLEITESTLLVDDDATRDTLAELKAIGVTLSVDDFGTGYSSLGYLQRFDVDVLKIDRTFVDALGKGDEQASIVPTILEIASRRHLATVAEGIEGAEQLAILRRLGCTLGQGYYFSRPLPAPGATELLVSGWEPDLGAAPATVAGRAAG